MFQTQNREASYK